MVCLLCLGCLVYILKASHTLQGVLQVYMKTSSIPSFAFFAMQTFGKLHLSPLLHVSLCSQPDEESDKI